MDEALTGREKRQYKEVIKCIVMMVKSSDVDFCAYLEILVVCHSSLSSVRDIPSGRAQFRSEPVSQLSVLLLSILRTVFIM